MGVLGVLGVLIWVFVWGINFLFFGIELFWIIDGMILSGQGGGEFIGFFCNVGGVILFNFLVMINFNDIEFVEVFKDVVVIVVYGFCGVNGVIIVIIKFGKGGKGIFDFNVNYGVIDVVCGFNEIGFVDGLIWFVFVDEFCLNVGLFEYDLNFDFNFGCDFNVVFFCD